MFAEISDTLQIVNAILSFLSVLLAPVVVALLALLKAKSASLERQRTRAKDSESVATDAVRVMQFAVDQKRDAEGKPPVKLIAPVKPEHESPVTEAQEATAKQATLRAAVAAAALELGVPARANPPAGTIDAATPARTPAPNELISKEDAIAAVLALPPATPKEPEAKADPPSTSPPAPPLP